MVFTCGSKANALVFIDLQSYSVFLPSYLCCLIHQKVVVFSLFSLFTLIFILISVKVLIIVCVLSFVLVLLFLHFYFY